MNKPTVTLGLKKVAVLCILKHKNQFLLLKRAKAPNKDMYTPVGGKLDPFESPLQCAIRETWEETGLKINDWKYCGTLTETSPTKYNWVSYTYLAEIEDIEPPYCNEGILKWIHFDELLQVPTPKTDWFIYHYLLHHKPFAFNAIFDENLNLLEMTEDIENLRLEV
jgi:8-oxo-dGTP diphosphatase